MTQWNYVFVNMDVAHNETNSNKNSPALITLKKLEFG